jgi:transglutaminase-like putative cysteine protease
VSGSPARVGNALHLHLRLARARWHVGVIGGLATLLAALSLQPLVDGAWWIPRTLVVVAAVVLTGGLVRMLRLPAPLQPLIQAGALLMTLTMLFARDQAVWGFLPGPAAVDRLRELAAQGREFSESTVPPAGFDLGLLLLIVAGIGLIALVVDTLVAGLDLPGVALIPLGALFVVPWVINRGWAPGWAFAAVALGWLGLLSAAQRDRAAHWSPEARAGSPGSGFAVAAITTALAMLAGGLATLGGPTGPVTIGPGIGGGGSVELDALVSLRRSLVNNDDRVVLTFATTAEAPDYLRLATLEEFDGETWRPAPATSLGPQPPAAPGAEAAGAGTGPLAEYRLDVGPLTGTALPSPSGTIASLNDWPVAWDQRTSLPVRTDGETIDGTRIGLVVAPATADAAALRSASTQATTSGTGPYPEDLADPTPLVGDELPQLAREVTAGAANPYDAAISLQQWFRVDGGFTYSTQIEGGSDEDALATFLDERVGYCEQFAATMALMARSVGIPARVVVGFTQGSRDGNTWVVRGTDAHAWPELWMGSAGWVRFEPTPGNATTTVPAYTLEAEPTEAPTTAPTTDSTAPEVDATGDPAQAPDVNDPDFGAAGTQEEGTPVGWLLVGLAALLTLVPALVRDVRRRRRMHTGDGESAYREVADSLVDLRLGAEAATPRATLAVVDGLVGHVEVREAATRILRAVEWQRYGGGASVGSGASRDAGAEAPQAPNQSAGRRGPAAVAVLERTTPSEVPGSRRGGLSGDVRVVRRALGQRAGWSRRIGARLVPRSVLRRWVAALTR